MTTSIFMNGRSQAVRLPKEFRLPGTRANVRRLGNGILLEPMKELAWPSGFFEDVLIEDPLFARPAQGETPSAPTFDR